MKGSRFKFLANYSVNPGLLKNILQFYLSIIPQSMCAWALNHFSHVQLFVTPWTMAFQAFLSMGFTRQEYWSWLPCPPPGDLPDLSLFSSVAQSYLTLQPHGLQHTRASLSITNSRSLLRLMSIESLMPSNHLILCRPRLLPPSIFPSIGVFSIETSIEIKKKKQQQKA